MNRLPRDRQSQILALLVEGSSMRSVSRVVGGSFNTIKTLLIRAGEACAAYHDAHIRDVPAQRVQCDKIWSFVYAKQENVARAKAARRTRGMCGPGRSLTPTVS